MAKAPIHRVSLLEVCILAGGLSSRMGRDKARVKLGGRTLLGHVRQAARGLGFPVRVIRRDLVERCGPLGGVYTALKTTHARAVFFLACDMALVSTAWLETVWRKSREGRRAVFTEETDAAGFPFVLPVAALPVVTKQIEAKRHSIRALAEKLEATRVRPKAKDAWQLANINTPAELARARKLIRQPRGGGGK
ncbi:MAG TPA: molybdenum cofactor guanylyltransferase [Verrucomicrobiae bacterium]|nr:molybdenum cofactor guanylyltransferase [Verrucomicrobiae bacterium]